MSDKPTPDAADQSRPEDDDVEGHSLSLAIGLGELGKPRTTDRTRQRGKDEDLAPLTKPFPRMKDERKR